MTTPRQKRLFSTADLVTFRRTILSCVAETSAWDRRASVVIVPSHAAADQLRWTLEQRTLDAGTAQVLPLLLTRDELYAELHRRADAPQPLLGPIKRLVCGRAAADEALADDEAADVPGTLLGSWRPSVELRRVPVTAVATGGSLRGPHGGPPGLGPVVGRLVHRLLQRAGENGAIVDAEMESEVVDVMSREERARPDSRQLAVDAAAVFRRVLSRPEVAELVHGNCLFEVPFSMCRDDLDEDPGPDHYEVGGPAILRGTIDCVLLRADGRLTVIELKTGEPQSHHQRQLSLYVDAARSLFPEAAVDGRVVYL